MESIEHRTTRVRSPRTNGFVEWTNRTLLDECFRVQGRQTRYTEPAEIQRHLDDDLTFYNFERARSGYRPRGRTPAQTLYDLVAAKRFRTDGSHRAGEMPTN